MTEGRFGASEFQQKTETQRTLTDLEFRVTQLGNSKMTVLGEESKGFPDELKSGVVKYLSTVEAPVVVDCGSGSGNVSSGIKTGVPKAKVFNFDLYPQSAGSNGTLTTQADLNDPIPIVDAVADISISHKILRGSYLTY